MNHKQVPVKQGPNWLELDGRSGEITAKAHEGNECVMVMAWGKDPKENFERWAQLTLLPEEAIRVAHEMLNAAARASGEVTA